LSSDPDQSLQGLESIEDCDALHIDSLGLWSHPVSHTYQLHNLLRPGDRGSKLGVKTHGFSEDFFSVF
jgi:hypothetical protein